MGKTQRYHSVLVLHRRMEKENIETIGMMPYGLGPKW